jgi:hypothetical protein
MDIRTLKFIGFTLSFISITIFLIFLATSAWKEIDNSMLKVVGTGFWLGMSVVNGLTHGKLLSNL